jgi:dihydrofolate reductase
MRGFSVVVAADEDFGIGKDGTLPWKLPGEMAHFKRVTSEAPAGLHNAVVMGRKTYASISPKFRPLRERVNMVLSRTTDELEGASCARSLDEALARLHARDDVARVFVIGGGELYRDALAHSECDEVVFTRVHARFACDTTLPDFRPDFALESRDGPHTENGLQYTFERYRRLHS